jgi:acyl-CoA thioesterase
MDLDPFMKSLGFQGGVTGPGQARLTAELRHEHLNNWGSAHGGFLFALADSAFALAANSHGDSRGDSQHPSHGPLAVSLGAHIEHLKPSQAGDILEATAREVSLTRRTGVYQVEIRRGEALVALFTGTAYRKA